MKSFGDLLSIVIPTADRVELLHVTLKKIAEELHACDVRIPVVIVDNASDPAVSEIGVTSEMSAFTDVRVIRYDDRVDVGDSIIRSVCRADSEYVWVFGDDDWPCPGAFMTILSVLKNQAPAMIYMNRYIASADMTRIEGAQHGVTVQRFRKLNGQDAIREFTHSPGFITSMVFRRTAFNSEVGELENKYRGYGFLSAVYNNILDEEVIYIPHPQVIQRRSEALWKQRWPQYWLITIPELFRDLERAGVPGAYDAVMKEVKKIWLRTFLMARAVGVSSGNEFWHRAMLHHGFIQKLVIKGIQRLLPAKIAKRIVSLGLFVKSVKG